MGSDWMDTIKEKAREALAGISSQEKDTAYGLLQALRRTGWVASSEGENLRLKHGNPEQKLTEEQRSGIRKHKRLMLHLMTSRPSIPERKMTWRDEWEFERDTLLRRAGCCWKEEDRTKLLAIADSLPQTDMAFTELWRRIRELEIELNNRGDLPPTEVF